MNDLLELVKNIGLESDISIEEFDKLKISLKNYLREKHISVKICETVDDLVQMITDYLNHDYRELDKKIIPFLCFSIIYFILPSSILKELIGEKKVLKSILIFSFSYYIIKIELEKYRKFLDLNKIVIENDYGEITYYRHRIKEE